MEHKFGGSWTELKLDTLRQYLKFYTTALNQKFRLHYIDGFAGIGRVTIKEGSKEKLIDGSARIAIETDPPFDQIHLIDTSLEHVGELRQLCANYPDRECHILHGDANLEIRNLLEKINWGRNERAVLFLDPYGMEVEWSTLEVIANTRAIDLWFLFPLSGLYRNSPRQYTAMDEHKKNAITRCLGTELWMDAFYEESPQQELFGPSAVTRIAEWNDLLTFVQKRLGKVFPKVADPLILPPEGAPLFALFFAISNPSKAAIKLSMKVAQHILKSKQPTDTRSRGGH